MGAKENVASWLDDRLASPILYTYDSRGFLSQESQGSQSVTLARDPMNRVISETDSAGNQIHYSYDVDDRPTAVTTAGGSTYSFGWDPNGNLISLGLPSGSLHTFTYSLAGALHEKSLAIPFNWMRFQIRSSI